MLGYQQDLRPANKQATIKALQHLSYMLDVKLGKVQPKPSEKKERKHNIVWEID